MKKDSPCESLGRFVRARTGIDQARVSQRCGSIQCAFAKGNFTNLPPPLGKFLQQVHAVIERVQALVIWGSYARGDESEQSFSIIHGATASLDYVVKGPSDVDALLVTNGPITLAPQFATYEMLSGTGAGTACELDVFRDVFQVPVDALSTFLDSRRPDHLSCIVDAWSTSGIVLLQTQTVQLAFERYVDAPGHRRVVEEALSRRFERLRILLECRHNPQSSR